MKMLAAKVYVLLMIHFAFQGDNYKMADQLYNNKQYESSLKICNTEIPKLNEKDSLYEKFLSLRASNYMQIKDYDHSIDDYLTLIRIKPEKTMYYIGLSYLYGETLQYKKCIDILKLALSVNDTDIYVLNNLSYYSNQIGYYVDGMKYAAIGLKYANNSEWKGALLNNKGYSYIGLGKYQDALNDINESIRLNADNSFAYCYRAIANIHLKRMQTVCDDLEKAKNLGAVSLTNELIKENCKN